MVRRFSVLLALSLFLSGQAVAANDKAPTKIKVGHLVAIDLAPLFVAKETNCFKDQGLDVDTVFFASPGDNNAALAGKVVDVSINPFTLPFFAANSGVPIRVIASAGGWGVMEVVAQGKLGLHSIGDVKAYVQAKKPKLKVGTLQGDTLELILTRAFDKEGISDKDVDIVYFNDLLSMVEAFRSGQLDILSHIKPYTTDMVETKGATVLTSNAQTWSTTTPNSVASVLESTIAQRKDLVVAYLKGLQCAADIINKSPEKAAELMSKGNYFRVPPAVLLASLKSAPAPVSFMPDVAVIQGVVDDLTKLGYIKGNTKASDIFRLDILEGIGK
jgi:ABC-type nitrate/sulfonate/bicarbonate transport system substrate-binding protein